MYAYGQRNKCMLMAKETNVCLWPKKQMYAYGQSFKCMLMAKETKNVKKYNSYSRLF